MKLLYDNNKPSLDLSIGDERYKLDMGGNLYNTYDFKLDN